MPFRSPVAGAGRCLVISHIYFNPFLHPDLFDALAEQAASEWARINR